MSSDKRSVIKENDILRNRRDSYGNDYLSKAPVLSEGIQNNHPDFLGNLLELPHTGSSV